MSRMKGLYGVVLAAVLLIGCSTTSTFLITRDGTSGKFGGKSSYFYKSLCTEQELTAILDDAGLPPGLRNDLELYTCSGQRSYEKVQSLYLFLTPEEKKQLQNAFTKHGYEVNHVNC